MSWTKARASNGSLPRLLFYLVFIEADGFSTLRDEDCTEDSTRHNQSLKHNRIAPPFLCSPACRIHVNNITRGGKLNALQRFSTESEVMEECNSCDNRISTAGIDCHLQTWCFESRKYVVRLQQAHIFPMLFEYV